MRNKWRGRKRDGNGEDYGDVSHNHLYHPPNPNSPPKPIQISI